MVQVVADYLLTMYIVLATSDYCAQFVVYMSGTVSIQLMVRD